MPLKSSFHTSIELMTGELGFEDPSNQSGYGLVMGIPVARKGAAELNCKEESEGKRRSSRGLVAAEEGGLRKKGKGGVRSTLLSQSRRIRRCKAVTCSPSEIFLSWSWTCGSF
ncbi:hypothetical protein CRG98_012346 [Punica granatum]|uniref:Uncharacterized protein n=1 Tax=Punica granatum TaxID=22663 RepID=A0A2I0KFI2_PUNGR|nr:hypothetical protein CRG98_012346 [Punica granatum]